MSRWLKSAVNILDKLDDRVETVAEDTSNILVDSDGVPTGNLTGLTNRFLGQQSQSESEDESYYDDDEEYYDDADGDRSEEAEFEDRGGANETTITESPNQMDIDAQAESVLDATAESASIMPAEKDIDSPKVVETNETPNSEAAAAKTAAQPSTREVETHGSVPLSAPTPASPRKKEIRQDEVQEPTPSLEKSAEGKLIGGPQNSKQNQIQSRASKAPPPTSGQRKVSPPASRSNNTSSAHARYANADLQKAQQEIQRLSKQNASLQTQLDSAQSELSAQNSELEQAAERMAEDRQLADEEREELLDEHEDALRNLKASYEARLKDQQETFQKQLEDLRHQLETEARMRAKEGGDMTEELGDAVERERQALENASNIQNEKMQLAGANEKLKMQGDALRENVKRLTEAAQASADRERQAEERLDAANTAHQRALNNRQAREQELERTVAELGAALAQKEAGQKANTAVLDSVSSSFVPPSGVEVVEQRKYDMAMEELDSTKAQLELATGRCEALQNELQILSRERTDEALAFQEKERGHNEKQESLATKISRLEASLREYKALNDDSASGSSATPEGKAPPGGNNQTGAKVRQLTRDLDKSQRQIASLSDQLLRQQGLTESAKSEALALRGRLQSATARAEAAEQASADTGGSRSSLHVESGDGVYGSGGAARRKRVRMGGRGGRTMRSALGLHTLDNSNFEQVAHTVDGLDLFMLETGAILRGEPLARLGLLVYVLILHLWCFGLVFFHAVESEHGDLGTLTARRQVLDVAQHHSP